LRVARLGKREFLIDNLLVRIHFIIVMIRWTGLAAWEFELGRGSDGSIGFRVLVSGSGFREFG